MRLVKRADGVYVQICIDVDKQENTEPSGNTIGLDVGPKEYYTDSNGVMVDNSRFLRQGEKSSNVLTGSCLGGLKVKKTEALARQILG